MTVRDSGPALSLCEHCDLQDITLGNGRQWCEISKPNITVVSYSPDKD